MRSRVAAAVFLVAMVTLPWFAERSPLLRAALAFLALLTFIKTTEIAMTPQPWTPWRRLWHLVSLFNVGDARTVRARISLSLLGYLVLHGALIGIVTVMLMREPRFAGARLIYGVIFVYSAVAFGAIAPEFAYLAIGIAVPSNHRAPILARSAQEFWGKRWNPLVSNWLSHFVFRPSARRRHPLLGLVAAFAVSGLMHSWLVVVAIGWRPALLICAYFVVQGLFVLGETRIRPQNWPPLAARVWTVLAVGGPSWLIVDPVLRIFRL
jgi:hypothetical protein